MSNRGWIGVDLDGTLAHYEGWQGIEHIGEPVPAMQARVLQWLEEGRSVKIFTARAMQKEAIPYIVAWCIKHLGRSLPVTNIKDYRMSELWDDRAVGIIHNTGQIKGSETDNVSPEISN